VVVGREVMAMLRRIAIGLVLALLVAMPVGARDFQRGSATLKRGD
jgi:hypothetical protein